ncbi:MAG TPA: hypothetical protein VF544_13695 [Pyrinomonadaceae bacterium]|jgi:hypothetical protein
MFIVLALIAVAGGTLSTYLYDEGSPPLARVCAGACVGLTGYGLLGFVYASALGLNSVSLALATLSAASPSAILLKKERRAKVAGDLEEMVRSVRRAVLRPSPPALARLLLYACLALLLWLVYERAMIEGADGISTGVANNFGDLPFHLSVVTSFATGANFPPEDPTYAGARFTYPFLADFIAACFVRAGATLRGAMLYENLLLALALVGLLHRWAQVLTRDRLATHLAPVLVLLSGGFGWWMLFDDVTQSGRGLLAVLAKPPHDYTIIPESLYRWGNALTTLLVPQRGMLLGLPLALIIFIEWWRVFAGEDESAKAEEGKKGRKKPKRGGRAEPASTPTASSSSLNSPALKRMIAAGIVAGLLPLAHAHTFVVVMMVGACLAFIQGERGWRAWAAFFIVSALLSGPQMWWATHASSVRAGTFFAVELGWDRGEANPVWFWLINAGLFIPLLAAALLWRGARPLLPSRLLLFYLPFTLCFFIPNLFKLAPWIWDNIKVLFYWYVASVPLVALLLARVWRASLAGRALVCVLVVALTLAGALDVWRVVARASVVQVFDPEGVAFAEMVETKTRPRALVLHAPIHNHPIFLTGRRSLMGYPGHIWTHGLDYRPRELEIKAIYAGSADAGRLLARYGVEYVVVSHLERAALGARGVNDAFFERYPLVGEVGDYRLYKIERPQ